MIQLKHVDEVSYERGELGGGQRLRHALKHERDIKQKRENEVRRTRGQEEEEGERESTGEEDTHRRGR